MNDLAESVRSTTLKLEIQRDDSMPGFGCFLRPVEQGRNGPFVIRLNVESCMSEQLETEDGELLAMSRDDRLYALITTLMHEFGHALECHFDSPVNEEAIERACEAWESATFWNGPRKRPFSGHLARPAVPGDRKKTETSK